MVFWLSAESFYMDPHFLTAAFLSEVVGTMAGFGSSTIFLPIALFFYDFKTALILVAIFHISGNIGRITFFREGFDKKMILEFGIPSVISTLVGAFLVAFIPQDILKLILGLFLIGYVFIVFAKEDFQVEKSRQNSLLGGGLSGFFAGLIGTGGALRSAFLTSFNLEKSSYISTASVISLAVDITRIPVYLGSGFLPGDMFILVPLLFVIAIIASFTGKKLVNQIPQDKFRKFVSIVIALAGLKFVYDGLVYMI